MREPGRSSPTRSSPTPPRRYRRWLGRYRSPTTDESNPVRVIDVFVDALDLAEMSFDGVEPAATGRPSYHPSVLLKLYIYGYLNRVQSSRRLERETVVQFASSSTAFAMSPRRPGSFFG